MAMDDIKGKVVALTGNGQVGYGTENQPAYGVVVSVSKAFHTDIYANDCDGNDQNSQTFMLDAATVTKLDATATDTYKVAVKTSVYKEGVTIHSTASKQPAVGNGVLVDGAGGVVKSPDANTLPVLAVCTAVDTAAKTATVKFL